ncbi:DeoR/GlpR family DNA-binding transcription regulator [Parasulfitobacter algicola]|uniref:DeoR/GlpR transcriptional regulator n=1 Tax=Parasulfitobacter algicola TaxID=2614809 RepID=A0ABX2IXR1_9RHOB|nr:DeoR/GlpR family DNA-binding transcription regulator [Sulfitobacter algicola]NSX55153.1 DeoR/GlpR transcriptional regulator [Sulfitobacter algicola]
MRLTDRQGDILATAKRFGKVTVDDLARSLSVTVQTVRRDLGLLADAGLLERIHGGAVLPSGVRNIGYGDRRGLNRSAKAAIARACATAIPDGSSLFLNIGTTTEAVAKELLRHKGLMVVTNNLNIANILAENPHCDVIVAGGRLRRTDGGLVGDLTTEMIGHFKVDIAIIGASGLDQHGDLLDFDPQEVRVSREILAQARQSYLVADASKFTRAAPVKIGSLAQIDRFFTDASLGETLINRCQDWGTQIVRV